MRRNQARRNEERRPRSAVGIMALIALPFLVGSGVSALHQVAHDPPEARAHEAAPAGLGVAPAPADVAASESDRT